MGRLFNLSQTQFSNLISLIRVLQRNRTNRLCVCVHIKNIYKEVQFKELAHTIMEYYGGKVQNLQGGPSGWRTRKRQFNSQFKSENRLLAKFPLAQGRSVFCSIQDFN